MPLGVSRTFRRLGARFPAFVRVASAGGVAAGDGILALHVRSTDCVGTFRGVRASRLERARVLPGDELIREAIASLTHAVTIRRPRTEVWPWLVQMGAGSRAGWYSYDFIDNGRSPSADAIEPDLRAVTIGTLFPAVPGATDGFHVLQLQRDHHLVLGWRSAPDAPPIMTWAFVLQDWPNFSTRLIVRARGSRAYPFYGLPRWIGIPVIGFGHYVMQRKQLLTIASRVESRPRGANRLVRRTAA
jgi:hypothetical protein